MLLSCHVPVFERIYILSCLKVNELLAQDRHYIWSLIDSNGIRTQDYLLRKRTLNYLVKLAKLLSCAVSTYLYSVFDCMLLSCYVRVLEWIYTL